MNTGERLWWMPIGGTPAAVRNHPMLRGKELGTSGGKSAAGRLVLNVMISVAQWEREAIGEWTRDALHLKQSKGESVGTVPFGCGVAADGVHFEANPSEHRILTPMRTLRAAGVTLRGICGRTQSRRIYHSTGRGLAV